MKILQYNIMDGCSDERFEQLKHWLNESDFDVIGFNELNGWNQSMFETKMKPLGYNHNFIYEMQTSPYFVGISSKWPIDVIRCMEDSPIYHGLIHVETRGIHFIIVHLTPFSSSSREEETVWIANYVKEIDEPFIVMGDFNSLSQHDHQQYEEQKVFEKLLQHDVLYTQHTKDGAINYRPMDILYEAGLSDVMRSDPFDYTMPTEIKGKKDNPLFLRIDYILVNEKLIEKVKEKGIIKDAATHVMSDHYPIYCELTE